MAHPLAPMANCALWGGQERKSSYTGLATGQTLLGLAETTQTTLQINIQ